jgi:hypothetical protein
MAPTGYCGNSRLPLRLTIAILMSDIGTEWTLNASLTTSSGLSDLSQCRTPDRSAGAISPRIEGKMERSRLARGLAFGSSTGFAAARE